MDNYVNEVNRNKKFKSEQMVRPEIWEPRLFDRFAAELIIDNQDNLLKDSPEERKERLKMLKENLVSSAIRPAAIESFQNTILITWIPRGGLVLCNTYEEYRDLCLAFSEYLDTIPKMNLKLCESVINVDCNYNEHDVEEDTEYLKPEFSKDNFNYLKEMKILDADYEI